MLKPGLIPVILGTIFVIVLLATSIYVVDQTEEAVITRFGKFLKKSPPGLHFKLPFNIDRAYIVRVTEVQIEEFGVRVIGTGMRNQGDANITTMLTGDLNMLDVAWIVQYRITDPVAWSFNVMERTQTIRDVSQSVINRLVGDRALEDIMGIERSEIQTLAIQYMNDSFRHFELGINVINVQLRGTNPPPRVQDAFDDVNRAFQDMNRLINEGQQAYNERIPRARGEAARLLQEAEGYAIERRNRAHGDVARFSAVLTEYHLAPGVTRQRLYYEMVEDVFRNDSNTAIIDRNLNNFLPFRDLGGR
jgi:membrane protease subunit HflK